MRLSIAQIAILLLTVTPARADTIIGPFTFADNAFADAVTYWQGGYLMGGASTIEQAVLGSDLNMFVNGPTRIALGFTDNVITNYAYAWDLIVFDLGTDGDAFWVAADLAAIDANDSAYYPTRNATLGYNDNGYTITATFVDLSDFGVPVGSSISTLAFSGSALELAAVGAIDLAFSEYPPPQPPVPEPSTLVLLGSGLLGLVTLKLRRKS